MRGLYLSEGAMLVQQAQLQVISNNLSNLRSTGFKRDHGVETSFAEWMLHELRPEPGPEKGGSLRPIGSIAHNVATRETVTAFTQGPLEVTDRQLDFALAGSGFFQVEGGEGILYTRNGRFELNGEGVLVTAAEGFEVIGEGGSIQLATDDVTVMADGSIFYNDGMTYGEASPGRLAIAVFEADAQIEKYGNNYFVTDAAEGGEDEFEVLSGFLEGSNVSLIREMTSLMAVRRSYEAAQKIMITYDQILNKAANELGSSA